VQPCALESREPLSRKLRVSSHRRQIERWTDLLEQALERSATFPLRMRHQIFSARRQQVEGDERSRSLLRQLCHARGRRMQPQLKRIKVQSSVTGDDDLAIHHAVGRQCFEQCGVKLGKITVQRAQVAALHKKILRTAEYDCAKTVPLRLEQE